MANRPVYIPEVDGSVLVRCALVHFDWFPGFSVTQARRSIEALHSSVRRELGVNRILEISTKSNSPLGVSLSAFNLKIRTVRKLREFPVESAYQASKVFENGGPYESLLDRSPIEAKRDARLSNSGRLVGFRFLGTDWMLEPRTAFYDWLYVNALRKQPDLLKEVLSYDAFTDIAFNPEKSVNCQAHSAALCVSLERRGLLTDALATREGFLDVLSSFDYPAMRSGFKARRFSNHELMLDEQKLGAKEKDSVPELFNSAYFRSWDGIGTLASVLSAWVPGERQNEDDIERSLYNFLRRELPDVKVLKDYSAGNVRADLAIADSLLLEVKANLNSDMSYRQLREQIAAWKHWDGEFILLLVGRSDPHFVTAIKREITERAEKAPESKVTIIQK